MPTIMKMLSPLLGSTRAILTTDDLAGFDPQCRGFLVDRKILVPTRGATHVVCDACHADHIAKVDRIVSRTGEVTFRMRCPEAGWVLVSPERLRQWTLDLEAVIAALHSSLRLSGRVASLIPGRLWRVGRTKWNAASRDVLYARRPAGTDLPQVMARIKQCVRPIILVGAANPKNGWPADSPPVVALADVVTGSISEIEIDHAALVAAVQQADARQQAARQEQPSSTKQRLARRRLLKEELKSFVEDEGIAESYRVHQSYRKVAEQLSAERGQPISKDHVARAIKRMGGPGKVLAKDSSKSVERAVASQHRDRTGKKLHRPQADEDE